MSLYLRQVALAVSDLDAVVEDLRAVFDTEVRHIDPTIGQYGIRNAVLNLGTQFVEVISPVQAEAPASRFISRRGEGLYAVLLQCGDDDAYRSRADGLGIRRIMELESGDFRCFQMHPSDARTSVILEIDRQPGAPHGPYYPGGNTVITSDGSGARGVCGITIRSAEPAQLARRWSQLLDQPMSEPGQSVHLANAALRFTMAPPTAATVDVAVADPTRVMELGERRSLVTGPESVAIGGVCFRLVSGDRAQVPGCAVCP